MNKIFHLATILFLLSGCNQNDKKEKDKETQKESSPKHTSVDVTRSDSNIMIISQNWIVTDAAPPQPKDLEAFGGDNHGQPSLFIMEDGSLVENPLSTYIRLGKYTLTGEDLDVKFDDGGTSKFTVLNAKNLQLQMKRQENGKATTLELTGPGVMYPKATDNPFHPSYNQWRIKAKRSEDEAQLKIRLRNYMDFYIMYLKDAVDNEYKSLDFANLPCCFNWYSGGISIQIEEELDPAWIECFYSKEQAFKARNILEKAVLRKHKWDKEAPNWIVQDLPVLRSIKDSI